MRTSSGIPTEMVFIFNVMLKKLRKVHQPDYFRMPTHFSQELSFIRVCRGAHLRVNLNQGGC